MGCDDSKLSAINPDGTEKWTFAVGEATGEAITASPAIGADGALYVVTEHGELYAIGE